MNNLWHFDGVELWQLAGWTMLHYLWLGAIVGVVAAASRLALRRAAPSVRYAAALGCFALLAAAPVGIAAWNWTQLPPAEEAAIQTAVPMAVPNSPAQQQAYSQASKTAGTNFEAPSSAVPLVSDPRRQPADDFSMNRFMPAYATAWLEICVPYLPWLWIVGAPITFVLLATGVVGADRLRRASRPLDEGPIVAACRRLMESLRITGQVTVAVCERIAAPVLVGIVRPVILLPPSALTGWSPDEIEMVLLHELAHVRRWDNFVNLLQRLVESLLFFHPAVWWVSSWVRHEREACCDAVVIGRTNRPHAYAEMLVALAAEMPRSVLFHAAASSAMAAGPLRSRIRRILQLEDDPMLVSGKSLAAVTAALAVATTLTVLYFPAPGNAEQSAANAEEFTTKVTEDAEEYGGNEHGDEILFFRKVFHLDRKNPLQTKVYKVSPAHREAIANAFEGWRKDPYGPQVQFETKWSSDDSQVTIVAPRDAQLFLAAALFQLKSLESEDLTSVAEGEATEGAANPKPEPVVEHHRQIEMTTGSGERVLAESEDGRLRVKIRDRKSGRFPSLEEQKLADLAWKALGLELEQIEAEDLNRVQALDYEDGLKVTGHEQGRYGVSEGGIQEGDILVGLHVWPTTSFEAVAAVLERDDLKELNPLKYYVVRGHHGLGERRDRVITGRITAGPSSSVIGPGSAVPGGVPPAIGRPFDVIVSAPNTPPAAAQKSAEPADLEAEHGAAAAIHALTEQLLKLQQEQQALTEVAKRADGAKQAKIQAVVAHQMRLRHARAMGVIMQAHVVAQEARKTPGLEGQVDEMLRAIEEYSRVSSDWQQLQPYGRELVEVAAELQAQEQIARHQLEADKLQRAADRDQREADRQSRDTQRQQREAEHQRLSTDEELREAERDLRQQEHDMQEAKLVLEEEYRKRDLERQGHQLDVPRLATDEELQQAERDVRQGEHDLREAKLLLQEEYRKRGRAIQTEGPVPLQSPLPAQAPERPLEAPHGPGRPHSAPAAMPTPTGPIAPPAAPVPTEPATAIAFQDLFAPNSGTVPQPSQQATPAFPHVVRFEQGASRFLDGDKITVQEVRGTAETFQPGNQYLIKGTYELTSHGRARLDAYVTAKDAAHGTSSTWKIQTSVVDRGQGTFELFLPMSHWGWPHVSFYPVDGGEGFGGTYIGTGDTVLKKWWGPDGVNDRTSGDAVQVPSSDERADEPQEEPAATSVLDEDLFGSEEVSPASAVWFGRRDSDDGVSAH